MFGGNRGNMGNMSGMMKKVQKLQAQMAQLQEDLKARELEVTAGGGVVTVKITGEKHIQAIKIDPSVVDADDVEMLEDLITAAVNEAINKVDEMTAAEMGKLTGGLNLPAGML